MKSQLKVWLKKSVNWGLLDHLNHNLAKWGLICFLQAAHFSLQNSALWQKLSVGDFLVLDFILFVSFGVLLFTPNLFHNGTFIGRAVDSTSWSTSRLSEVRNSSFKPPATLILASWIWLSASWVATKHHMVKVQWRKRFSPPLWH